MRRILLAEDNRINQIVAAGVLKKLGFHVDIVDDGAAAVTAYLAHSYDAVLMDVMMPGVDGYQATGLIREHERSLRLVPIPIIGLSARAMPYDRDIAFDAGMTDYLTKPLRTAALEESLERWITRHQDVQVASAS